MSRLADRLMGMDRGASRPEGVGGIPRLTTHRHPTPRWRAALGFVIVVIIMVCSGIAIMLQWRSVAPPIVRASAPVAQTPPVRPATADERFVVLLGRGLQAAEDGLLLEATEVLKKALALKPGDAEAWNRLGVVLVRQGDTAGGSDAFRQALRARPTDADAHRNLAVLLDRQGRSREAAIHYRAFLRLSAESHADRADVRRRLGEMSVSISIADESR